jgi:hypothetical protein
MGRFARYHPVTVSGKVDRKVFLYDVLEWIQLAQNRVYCRVTLNTAINLRDLEGPGIC